MSWKKNRLSREQCEVWETATTQDGSQSAKPLTVDPCLAEPTPLPLDDSINDQENCAPIKLQINLARHSKTMKSAILASTQRRDRATNIIRNENYYGGMHLLTLGQQFSELENTDQPQNGRQMTKRQPLSEITESELTKGQTVENQPSKPRNKEFRKKRIRRDVFEEEEQEKKEQVEREENQVTPSQIKEQMIDNIGEEVEITKQTTPISEKLDQTQQNQTKVEGKQNTLNQSQDQENNIEQPSQHTLSIHQSATKEIEVRPIWVPQLTHPTFFTFMLYPLPDTGPIKFYIKRTKIGFKTHYRMISDNLRAVMYAQPQSGTIGCNYHISVTKETDKNSEGYLGKLRSNFSGSRYKLYGKGDKPTKNEIKENDRMILADVDYETNIMGMKGPRRIHVWIPQPKADPSLFKKVTSQNLQNVEEVNPGSVQYFRNRIPKWNSKLNSYALNFGGRVKMASIKNFMLEDRRDPDVSHVVILEKLLHFWKN